MLIITFQCVLASLLENIVLFFCSIDVGTMYVYCMLLNIPWLKRWLNHYIGFLSYFSCIITLIPRLNAHMPISDKSAPALSMNETNYKSFAVE